MYTSHLNVNQRLLSCLFGPTGNEKHESESGRLILSILRGEGGGAGGHPKLLQVSKVSDFTGGTSARTCRLPSIHQQ